MARQANAPSPQAGVAEAGPEEGRTPVLLRERPLPLQVVIAAVVPAVFGAICGVLLGINEIAYLVLALLAIAGGFVAGMEHRGPAEGALRGLVGGSLFGGFILIAHEATGEEATAELPHPAIILVAVTAVFGVLLGALGGRARVRMETRAERGPFIDLSRLQRAEYLGFLAAAVLFGSLFLPWFSTNTDNNQATIDGKRGELTAFDTYVSLDWLLVAACSAPFILAYIIARGHALGWRPGEVTAIVGLTAFVLIFCNGIVFGKPGEPNSEISFEIGWFLGLGAAAAIVISGFLRQLQGVGRKPPGV